MEVFRKLKWADSTGDAIPFYHDNVYHIFSLTSPPGTTVYPEKMAENHLGALCFQGFGSLGGSRDRPLSGRGRRTGCLRSVDRGGYLRSGEISHFLYWIQL